MDGPAALVAAKFGRNSQGDPMRHPLICHMADVAAVAEALWDDCLAERVHAHLAEGCGLTPDAKRQWIAFLASTPSSSRRSHWM